MSTYSGVAGSGVNPTSSGATQNITRQEFSNFTINVEKLSGENFGFWKFQMGVTFRARKLLAIVDGSLTRLGSEDPAEWDDKDAACQSMLLSAIEPKLIRRLTTCKTSNQMWRRLCLVYELNAAENIQLLQQKFYELRMKPGTDMAEYINSVEELANQLNDLGESISEQAVISKIMCSLTQTHDIRMG